MWYPGIWVFPKIQLIPINIVVVKSCHTTAGTLFSTKPMPSINTYSVYTYINIYVYIYIYIFKHMRIYK